MYKSRWLCSDYDGRHWLAGGLVNFPNKKGCIADTRGQHEPRPYAIVYGTAATQEKIDSRYLLLSLIVCRGPNIY